MDGITDFDMKFKRSLIEQLDRMNKNLEHIHRELAISNDFKHYGKKKMGEY